MIYKINKKLIIISILFMLCLVSFYGVIKYYSNKDIELETVKNKENTTINERNITLADTINNDEEIILGDEEDDGCAKKETYCSTGDKCYGDSCCTTSTVTGIAPYNCTGSWSNGICTKFTKVGDQKTKCAKCKEGYEKDGDSCKMICRISSVRVGNPSKYRMSIGEDYEVSVTYTFSFDSSEDCPLMTMSTDNGEWRAQDTPKNIKSWTTKFIVTPVTGCKHSHYSFSYGVSGGVVEITSKWLDPTPLAVCREATSGECTTQSCADGISKKDYYLTDEAAVNYSGSGRTSSFCSIVRRGECCDGCTIKKSGSPACYKNATGELKWTNDSKFGTKTNKTKSECKNCYGNSRMYSLATKVAWLSEASNAYPEYISSIKSESACKKETAPKACVPVNTGDPKNKKTLNTKSCEDTIENMTTDGMSCKGNPYYTISCTNKTSTNFDLGDDGIITSTNNLLVGQGFKYGITAKVVRTCDGKFDGELWQKAYEYVSNVIKKAKKEKDKASKSELKKIESLIIENQNKQKKLKELVTAYNNYDLNKGTSITSKINLSYKVNGKTQTLTTELISTDIQKGVGKKKDKGEVNLNVKGLTNPHNYSWTNESKPTIVKLIPPKKYMDNNGKIASSGIDAGNKIYVDYYTEPKTYPLNIKANGIGGNIVIENNKCNIKVVDQEIIYRPIDISNPFISKDWIPGINWINDLFDFKNIIRSDIWSK